MGSTGKAQAMKTTILKRYTPVCQMVNEPPTAQKQEITQRGEMHPATRPQRKVPSDARAAALLKPGGEEPDSPQVTRKMGWS